MSPPSFNRLCWQVVAEHRRTRQDPRWQYTRSKQAHHALLAAIGAPHAPVHAVISAAELTPHHLREPRVVKPDGAASGLGILVLDPLARRGVWREGRTGAHLTLPMIQERMRRALRRHPGRRTPDRWLLEQRLEPPPGRRVVDEFKVFCFGARPELVMGHRAGRVLPVKNWFTTDWRPTRVGRRGDRINPRLTPPPAPLRGELLKLASRVAAALPQFVFVRVDIFWTARGLVVGEVNDHDGNRTFGQAWDQRLGEAWLRAERERVAA